jgi:hypothetical protein
MLHLCPSGELRKYECQLDFEKKERPGYEWGPRWGADGSSSPAFAWGQALGLGGGDCQRNDS